MVAELQQTDCDSVLTKSIPMSCYNFDGFHVVDQDDFPVFSDVGLSEDLMAIGAMNGKQHQFGSFDGLGEFT